MHNNNQHLYKYVATTLHNRNLWGDWKTRKAGTALCLQILSRALFWLFELQQFMCTNYISGLPSRALSRAERLLKINLDVDVKLLVND